MRSDIRQFNQVPFWNPGPILDNESPSLLSFPHLFTRATPDGPQRRPFFDGDAKQNRFLVAQFVEAVQQGVRGSETANTLFHV